MSAIDLAAIVAEGLINTLEARNTCIDTTRILVAACERVGIKARPQAVDVRVFNSLAWDLYGMRVPLSQWPQQAHSLATGPGRAAEGGWDGHLVTITIEDGQRHLIDASASQFQRPGKIEVAEVVGMTISSIWTPDDPMYRLFENRTVIEYSPMPPQDPRIQTWKNSGAWNDYPEWYADATDAVVEKYLKEKG